MSVTSAECPRCGSPLSVGDPAEPLCPRCLLALASDEGPDTDTGPPAAARRAPRRPPWWALAIAAAFVGYFALLVYCDLWRPEDAGFVPQNAGDGVVVARVVPGSPAARAGITPGDVLRFAAGRSVHTVLDWSVIDAHVVFERPIDLTLVRQGSVVETALVLPRGPWSYLATSAGLLLLVTLTVQALMLVLAVVILFKRPGDLTAGLGACLLGSAAVFKIVLPSRVGAVWSSLPAVFGAVMWLPFASYLGIAGVLSTFFMTVSRRATRPVWFWAAWWTPMLLALVAPMRSAVAMVYTPTRSSAVPYQGVLLALATSAYAVAALVALMRTYRDLTDRNERRRVQVLLVGATAGIASGLLLIAYYSLRSNVNLTQSILAGPGTALGTVGLLLFPASFGYAILRHRLFELSALVRQGVQYALAKSVIASLVPTICAALVLDVVVHRDEALAATLGGRWHLYAAAITLATVALWRRHAWLNSLDRRFFREQYRRAADSARGFRGRAPRGPARSRRAACRHAGGRGASSVVHRAPREEH